MARNKYPEETVQKILEAANKAFLEKGYEQTTILDIVENMGGLTRGAFYHHFKSKEEVLDALGDKLFYENNPFENAKQQTHLNGLEKLRYMIISSIDNTASRKITIISLKALESPTFLKKVIDDNRDIFAPFCQELIEEGIADGSIQTNHAKMLSQLIVFLFNLWTIPTIYPSSPEESLERLYYIREITDKMGLPLFTDELIEKIISNALEMEATIKSQKAN